MIMKITALVVAVSALASASSNSTVASSSSSVAAVPAASAFACVPKQQDPNCGADGNMICCPEKPLHSSPNLLGSPEKPLHSSPNLLGIHKRTPNWKPEDLPKLCPERCHEFSQDSECLIPCLEGLPTWDYREPKYKDNYPCIPINRDVDCTKRPPKWCCRDHVYQADMSHVKGETLIEAL